MLQRAIQANLIKFRDMPMHFRDRLPKINDHRKTRELIVRTNKAFDHVTRQEHDLTDLNTLIYSTAYTVTYQITPIKLNKIKKLTVKHSESHWEIRI